MEIVILIIIGVIAGLYSGLLGIGGGLIMVPALVFFAKMSQHTAQGTSLLVMLPPITLLSAYAYYRNGHIDPSHFKIALILCVAFVIGGYFGGRIAVVLPEFWLRRIFGVFLLIISIKMLIGK
jgi:uncharacterized membrane protein YfcA